MAATANNLLRHHPLAECETCPLRERGLYVSSAGPREARLCIAGEAPGVNEARAGIPFIGDSGQLLNRILKHYSIDRREVRLLNAVGCREPDGSTPPAKAIQACRPRFIHELQEAKAKDVVTLGNISSQSLLQTRTGITSLRVGFGHENRQELPGTRILCTFHPAAALRRDKFFPSIVTDFGKLRGHNVSWYEPRWKAYETPSEALAALTELQKIPGEVVVDIESNIEKDISFENPSRHQLLCVGLGFAEGRIAVIGEAACQDEMVLRALLHYLQTHPITAQNGKFDLKGLWAKLFRTLLTLEHDTMLSDYAIDERAGIHSLDYQAIEKLGAPNWKAVLNKYKKKSEGYGAIVRTSEGRNALYKYNAYDVHATALVKKHNVSRLRRQPELLKLHDFLCRASDQLMPVELNGIGIDLEYNAQLTRDYTTVLDDLESSIADTIPNGHNFNPSNRRNPQFNPRSPLQVKRVVKDTYGLRLPMAMNQNREYRETTNAEALEGLLAKSLGKPAEHFFRAMLEYRKEHKLFSTYVKGIRKRVYRGRVYPTFLLHGTTSGRLSCRNPNLQNIVRGSKMRRQFVPCIEGNVFVEGDFAQAELRGLCWLARDPYLQTVFNDPSRDLFDELRPRLYGDVSGLSEAELKELRVRVKAFAYGLSYGRTPFSVALEYGMPVREAERAYNAFFKVIPATVQFRDETMRKVLNGQDLVTPRGRHRRFWLITDSNRKDVLNEALSFLPQSIASDICLDAFIHLRPDLKGIGYIRNIVHDSILAECPPENVPLVVELMQQHMLEAAQRIVGDYVQFRVDFSVGPNWGDLSKYELAA